MAPGGPRVHRYVRLSLLDGTHLYIIVFHPRVAALSAADPLCRTPAVQERALVPAPTQNFQSPEPLDHRPGTPSGVFKSSYEGDLFGTGGNYMGGCAYEEKMVELLCSDQAQA